MTTLTDASMRERLVEAASQLTCDTGWAGVTMAKVAARAGVSRQTVYNELGTKPELGQAMVLRELERFLAVVTEELEAYDDLVAAIRAAAHRILLMADQNPLLHAVLTSAHGVTSGAGGANTELLPFLTTDAAPLIEAAKAVIIDMVPARFPDLGLAGRQLDAAVDAIVRLVLSHVMQPAESPDRTADDLAWIVGQVLRR